MTPLAAPSRFLSALLLLLAGGSLACGGGGSTTPDPGPDPDPEEPVFVSVEVAPGVNLIPMARFRATVDPATLDATLSLETLRSTAVFGERFLIDATSAIQSTFAENHLQVQGVRLTAEGRVAVTYELTHPIPLPNLEQPVSAMNRLDLHLFGPHLLALSEDPGRTLTTDVLVDPFLLANPQGYSRAFPTTVTGTTTTAHPYRVFVDGALSSANPNLGPGNFDNATGYASLTAPVGFNIFPQGSSATTELEFVTRDTPITLDLLVAAYYVDPLPNGLQDRLPSESGGPVYLAPAGAGTAPWWVDVQASAQGILPKQATGTVALEVRVADWQVGYSDDPEYPDVANPAGLPMASRPTALDVHLPDFATNPVVVTEADNVATATGFIDNPLTYTLAVPNSLAPIGGTYLGWVEVHDQATPGTATPGGSLDDLLGLDANEDFFSLLSTSTYQVFTVTVPAGTEPPFVELIAESEYQLGDDVVLEVNACDIDGNIIGFEWDTAFDGSFDITDTTTDPTLALSELNRCSPSPAPFTVAVRARDNDGLTSPINCEETTGSTLTLDPCALSGPRPRTCQTIQVLPRAAAPAFATDVNVGGTPATTSPFMDTYSSGQHALVVRDANVWVAWHAVTTGFTTGNVFAARSTNSGASFSAPVNLSNVAAPTPPAESGEVANHPALAVNSAGNPVVIYALGPILDQNIVIHPSSDGGATFGQDIKPLRPGNQGLPSLLFAPDDTLYFSFVDFSGTAGDRIWAGKGRLDAPELALNAINDTVSDAGATVRLRTDYLVSQTSPAILYQPGAERVAVIWSDAARLGNDSAQIVSDSTGLTTFAFGADVPVAPEPVAGMYQFQPSPVIDPSDNSLLVAYREAGLEGSDAISDIWVVRSLSGDSRAGFQSPIQVSDSIATPRYSFAPSLGAGPSGDLYLVWQGAPAGNTNNYDLFLDTSLDGVLWGTDTPGIENEVDEEEGPFAHQAFNPMLATTGCDIYVAWAGTFDPRDNQNSFTIYVDVGS